MKKRQSTKHTLPIAIISTLVLGLVMSLIVGSALGMEVETRDQGDTNRSVTEARPVSVKVCGTPMLGWPEDFVYEPAETKILADPPGNLDDQWLYNFDTDTYYQADFDRLFMTDHFAVYLEDGESFSETRQNRLREALGLIYQVEVSGPNNLGTPPDHDGYERVLIFLADLQGSVLGYFNPIDQSSSDPNSNDIDVVYVNVTADDDDVKSTTAHEFCHMLEVTEDPDDDLWVKEGIAQYAEFLVFGDDFGHDKVPYFESHPDVNLTWTAYSADLTANLRLYGCTFTFFLYIHEKYGGQATVAAIFHENSNGIGGINQALSDIGQSANFETVFDNWTVANYLDDDNINSLYQYDHIDIEVEPEYSETLIPVGGSPVIIGGGTTAPSPVENAWAANYVRTSYLSSGFTLESEVWVDPNSDSTVILLHDNDLWRINTASGNPRVGGRHTYISGLMDNCTFVIRRKGQATANGQYTISVVKRSEEPSANFPNNINPKTASVGDHISITADVQNPSSSNLFYPFLVVKILTSANELVERTVTPLVAGDIDFGALQGGKLDASATRTFTADYILSQSSLAHDYVAGIYKYRAELWYNGYPGLVGAQLLTGPLTFDLLISGDIAMMDFEDGVDGHVIASTIPGMQFITTAGYDWVYGDIRTGNYNVYPYGTGAYYCHGNFFAWLGVNQGWGRINFTGATTKSISILYSSYNNHHIEAYDASDNLIDSDQGPGNLWTNTMNSMTVSGDNIAYVLIHDEGNYWLIDDLVVVDLLRETAAMLPEEYGPILEDLRTINPGGTASFALQIEEIAHDLEILLNWGGSELYLALYDPFGNLYGEWQTTSPPMHVSIPAAMPGEWEIVVAAVDVPSGDYPYALVVGAKGIETSALSGYVVVDGPHNLVNADFASLTGARGVRIDVIDDMGQPFATTFTDEYGYYSVQPLSKGEYDVKMKVPTGFTAYTDTVTHVVANGLPVEAHFGLSDESLQRARDLAWWRTQLMAIQGGASIPGGLAGADIDEYGQTIFECFCNRGDEHAIGISDVTYVGDSPRALKCINVFSTLIDGNPRPGIEVTMPEVSTELKSQRGLLTAMLNIAAGYLSQLTEVSADGATVSQAITYFSRLHRSGDYSQCENVLKISRNELIAAGVIPLETPNVLFKSEDIEELAAELLPDRFALEQNYPNPFNPVTDIQFSLPEPANVRLDVFNVLGQKVATLLDENLPAGYHRVEWDAGSYASGVYLYRIQAGTFTDTRKMVLLK